MHLTLLILSPSGVPPSALQTLLQEGALGPDVLARHIGAPPLEHALQSPPPDQLLMFGPAPALLDALQGWQGQCPLSWVASTPRAEELAQMQALGLSGWWPLEALTPESLALALALDRERWKRESALQRELAQCREQLSDRKWLDRAKGVLAQTRGLEEDAAFQLLRSAAMQSSLKIGEVSRSVIEATAWAEAMNRAGQLRMLSQRMVKLLAQRVMNLDTHRARKLQEDTEQRAQAHLAHLASLPLLATQDPAQHQALNARLTETGQAWSDLLAVLAQRKSTALLEQADAQAATLLQHAEALTNALEAASHRRVLRVVNLCGRQRMLTQRLTKDALLAEHLNDAQRRQQMPQWMDAFENALQELQSLPVSSPEIRVALQEARDEWAHLLQGLRFIETPEGRQTLVRSSEALLEKFDQLTLLYEHSLQVIMS